MRFLSEDGKVFNTEEECCAHEKGLLENDLKEWEQMYNKMYKIYSDFCKNMKEYQGMYGFKEPFRYPTIDEFMSNLRTPMNTFV